MDALARRPKGTICSILFLGLTALLSLLLDCQATTPCSANITWTAPLNSGNPLVYNWVVVNKTCQVRHLYVRVTSPSVGELRLAARSGIYDGRSVFKSGIDPDETFKRTLDEERSIYLSTPSGGAQVLEIGKCNQACDNQDFEVMNFFQLFGIPDASQFNQFASLLLPDTSEIVLRFELKYQEVSGLPFDSSLAIVGLSANNASPQCPFTAPEHSFNSSEPRSVTLNVTSASPTFIKFEGPPIPGPFQALVLRSKPQAFLDTLIVFQRQTASFACDLVWALLRGQGSPTRPFAPHIFFMDYNRLAGFSQQELPSSVPYFAVIIPDPRRALMSGSVAAASSFALHSIVSLKTVTDVPKQSYASKPEYSKRSFTVSTSTSRMDLNENMLGCTLNSYRVLIDFIPPPASVNAFPTLNYTLRIKVHDDNIASLALNGITVSRLVSASTARNNVIRSPFTNISELHCGALSFDANGSFVDRTVRPEYHHVYLLESSGPLNLTISAGDETCAKDFYLGLCASEQQVQALIGVVAGLGVLGFVLPFLLPVLAQNSEFALLPWFGLMVIVTIIASAPTTSFGLLGSGEPAETLRNKEFTNFIVICGIGAFLLMWAVGAEFMKIFAYVYVWDVNKNARTKFYTSRFARFIFCRTPACYNRSMPLLVSWRWDIKRGADFEQSEVLKRAFARAKQLEYDYAMVDVITLNQRSVDAAKVMFFVNGYAKFHVLVAIDLKDLQAKADYESRFWANVEMIRYHKNNRVYSLSGEGDRPKPVANRLEDILASDKCQATYNVDRLRVLLLRLPFASIVAYPALAEIRALSTPARMNDVDSTAIKELIGIAMPLDWLLESRLYDAIVRRNSQFFVLITFAMYFGCLIVPVFFTVWCTSKWSDIQLGKWGLLLNLVTLGFILGAFTPALMQGPGAVLVVVIVAAVLGRLLSAAFVVFAIWRRLRRIDSSHGVANHGDKNALLAVQEASNPQFNVV